jgi:hypothetical protein
LEGLDKILPFSSNDELEFRPVLKTRRCGPADNLKIHAPCGLAITEWRFVGGGLSTFMKVA